MNCLRGAARGARIARDAHRFRPSVAGVFAKTWGRRLFVRHPAMGESSGILFEVSSQRAASCLALGDRCYLAAVEGWRPGVHRARSSPYAMSPLDNFRRR